MRRAEIIDKSGGYKDGRGENDRKCTGVFKPAPLSMLCPHSACDEKNDGEIEKRCDPWIDADGPEAAAGMVTAQGAVDGVGEKSAEDKAGESDDPPAGEAGYQGRRKNNLK